MTSKETKALERLAPKLTALRQTLRGEERRLLDQMVLGARAEVTTHSAIVGQKTNAKMQKMSEVALHSASVSAAKVGSKVGQPVSEVALHSAGNMRPIERPTSRPQPRINLQKGIYQVIID